MADGGMKTVTESRDSQINEGIVEENVGEWENPLVQRHHG